MINIYQHASFRRAKERFTSNFRRTFFREYNTNFPQLEEKQPHVLRWNRAITIDLIYGTRAWVASVAPTQRGEREREKKETTWIWLRVVTTRVFTALFQERHIIRERKEGPHDVLSRSPASARIASKKNDTTSKNFSSRRAHYSTRALARV